MEQLQQAMEGMLSGYSGRFGIVVKQLGTGRRWEYNPSAVFPAASMIKVPIMYEIMRQAAEGRFSLDMPQTVSEQERVGGAGILKELRPNIVMTVRELITLMIIVSDNTATNMLINLIGMASVNEVMKERGLKATELRRHMMDFDAARDGRENETSAGDMAAMLETIYRGQGVPPAYAAEMMDILKRQQVRDKLPFFLPEETVFANKTGTLSGFEHDGGILYTSGGDWVISVFTGDLQANYQGIELVARMGKIIYDYAQQTGGER